MRFYIPQLDGLRFLAFLSVFIGHAAPAATYVGTAAGLELFFVLSSYLITALLVRESDATGRINVLAFWARRALRIWPLYFSFLFANAIVAGMPDRALVAFALFAGNWVEDPGPGPIAHLWSVSVEEQFYVAWPLVLTVLPRSLLRPACVALVVVAVAGRYGLYLAGVSVGAAWFNSVAHLDALGLGALIALAPRVELCPAARGVLGASAPLVVLAVAVVLWRWLLAPPASNPVAMAPAVVTLAFLGASLACGGALVAALAGSAWLSHPALVYLGRISYGLYVFHMAAIHVVSAWWWPYKLPAAFALTLALAAVSYHSLERPFLRLKARYTSVRTAPAP